MFFDIYPLSESIKISGKIRSLPFFTVIVRANIMSKYSGTVGSSAYERIKKDIIFGVLTPRTKLKLDAMKAQYSVSISTLRETLTRLASEGFVVAEEQRGFFVAPVSKEDLIEISNLRILLECTALKTSIELGDTEWEANLVAAYHKLHVTEKQILEGDDSAKENWKRYDCEFHQAMISACNSSNLLSLHSVLYNKYLRYQMSVLTNRGSVAVKEHKAMFDAALKRDAEKAQAILEKHITLGLNHTLKEFNPED